MRYSRFGHRNIAGYFEKTGLISQRSAGIPRGLSFQIKTMLYKKKCIARGDMQRSKGVRSETRIPQGKICGFKNILL